MPDQWNPWVGGNSNGWNFSSSGGQNFAGSGGSAPTPGAVNGGIMGGASQLAGMGNQMYGQAQQAYGQAQSLYNPQAGVAAGQAVQSSVSQDPRYANQALATGFNDNNQLYNRELNHITEANNASLSERGLGMSPYGAQLANDANQQFNAGWEQQQLQNQATAAQTAATLQGQYSSSMQAGNNMQQQAAMQPLMQLSSFVNSANTASQPLQAGIGDMLSYLSIKHSGSGGGGGGGGSGGALETAGKIAEAQYRQGFPSDAENPGGRDALGAYQNMAQQLFNAQMGNMGW